MRKHHEQRRELQTRLDGEKLRRLQLESELAKLRLAETTEAKFERMHADAQAVHAAVADTIRDLKRKHDEDIRKLKAEHKRELERASLEIQRAWHATDGDPPAQSRVVPKPNLCDEGGRNPDRPEAPSPVRVRGELESVEASVQARASSELEHDEPTGDAVSLDAPAHHDVSSAAHWVAELSATAGPSRDVGGWSLSRKTARVTLNKATATDAVPGIPDILDLRRCLRCGLNDSSAPSRCCFHPFHARGSSPPPGTERWHQCAEESHSMSDPPCQLLPSHDYTSLLPPASESWIEHVRIGGGYTPNRAVGSPTKVHPRSHRSHNVPPLGNPSKVKNQAEVDWQRSLHLNAVAARSVGGLAVKSAKGASPPRQRSPSLRDEPRPVVRSSQTTAAFSEGADSAHGLEFTQLLDGYLQDL